MAARAYIGREIGRYGLHVVPEARLNWWKSRGGWIIGLATPEQAAEVDEQPARVDIVDQRIKDAAKSAQRKRREKAKDADS
ncbi:MAG: hypothetical protein AAF851_05700 [Myxococcota bacterium]